MGWTFSYSAREKDQIIKECTGLGTDTLKCIDQSCSGGQLWTVWEQDDGRLILILFLLQKDRREGVWGYKDMDESMHPYYYDCPQKFLDMVPVACAKWREEVKLHKQRVQARRDMFKRLKVGSVVKCKNCKPDMFVVVSTNPLVGNAINGGRYKISKRYISEVMQEGDVEGDVN
jgi:hypothetical protein